MSVEKLRSRNLQHFPSFRAMSSSSVIFVWPHAGSKVELAGSFNGWKPVEMVPSADRKLWQLPMELQRGHHEFKFVVDGRWCHDPEQNSGVNDVGSLNNVVDVEDVGAWKPLILSDWTTENWLLIEMTLKWIQYIFIFSIWKSWFSYNSDRERWRWLGSYWKIGRLGKMFANKILSIKLAIISIVGECRITWNFSENYHF